MIVRGKSAIIDYDDQGLSLNLKKKIFTKCQHENVEAMMKHRVFSTSRSHLRIFWFRSRLALYASLAAVSVNSKLDLKHNAVSCFLYMFTIEIKVPYGLL